MKNKSYLILIAATFFMLSNCKKNNSTTPSGSQAVGKTTGTVEITASWTTAFSVCNPAYNVEFGLGYNSNDVVNEAYFTSANYSSSPATYKKDNLAPGTYYYKAKKTFNTGCGTGQGIPPTVSKNGAFTITAGQTTKVSAGSLN